MVTKPSPFVYASHLNDFIWAVAVSLLAFSSGLWSYLSIHPYLELPFDDSYITQVFARHLFQVGGFSFDGETISGGATSPLHVALLAMLQSMYPTPVGSALGLGIACQALALVLTIWLLLRLGCHRWLVVAAGSVMAINGFLITDALNGLETSLFHLFAIAATLLLTFQPGKIAYTLLGTAVGASIATRPEGILLMAGITPVFLWRISQEWREQQLRIAPWLFLVLPVLILGLGSRGTDLMVGGTAQAKLILWGELKDPVGLKLRTLWEISRGFWLPHLFWLVPGLIGWYGFLSRTKPVVFQHPWIQSAVVWLIVAALFYTGYGFLAPGALEQLDYRYQHILIPPILVLSALGIHDLLSRAEKTARKRLVLGLAVLCVAGSIHSHVYSRDLYGFFTQVSRNGLLRTADWIQSRTNDRAVVAAHDIGAVGYFSQRKLIDLSGLVNDEVRPYVKDRKVMLYLQKVRPDYLIVLPLWARQYLGLRPELHPETFTEVLRSSMAYGEPYTVYRCSWPESE